MMGNFDMGGSCPLMPAEAGPAPASDARLRAMARAILGAMDGGDEEAWGLYLRAAARLAAGELLRPEGHARGMGGGA